MRSNQQQIQKVSAHVQFETVSPATKLLEKRRKMYEVHEAFQVQKQEFKKQEQTFKGIEEDIRKRDLDIQIHLINFCQFLQQNDSKRKKAEERFKQEQQVYKKKEQQILKLQSQIATASDKQEKFDRKVTSLRKYQQYLQKVRAAYGDQYPQMSDILNRYQTLKKFNNNLLKDRETMEESKDKLKKESMLFEKQMNQNILQLSNEIKDLSKKLQERVNKKQQLESDLEHTRDEYSKKNLDLAKILMSLDNLYAKCGDGTSRVKHDYEEYKNQNQNKKTKVKKTDEKKKKDDQINKEDEEDNLQKKCRLALQKLKSVFSYTKDYKYILQQYRKGIKK